MLLDQSARLARLMCVLALAVTVPNGHAFAQGYNPASLLQAMADRTDTGPPLRALKRAGYIAQRPLTRSDYDDYYIPRKPLIIMGSKVVLVAENYFLRNIGCCVDQGVGLYFELSSSTSAAEIKAFANRHNCKIAEGVADIYTVEATQRVFRPNKDYIHVKCGVAQ